MALVEISLDGRTVLHVLVRGGITVKTMYLGVCLRPYPLSLTMSPYLNPIEHTIVLNIFDNGRIIQRMYRTLSMPWFRNCSPCHKRAS